MAVVSVAADNARYDSMDTTANISGIGGGAGAGAEPDIVYQGNNSISRKVTGAGFYTSTGAARNFTVSGRTTWLVKTWLTNYGSLSTAGNKHEVRIGSGTGAYYSYIIGDPTRLYPARGGWVIDAIDPSIASHRDGTVGSPSLTACDYFAAFAECTSSKAENLCLDSIDCGTGLYLTGGDGADADGVFDDFVVDDEDDTAGGRFGYIQTQNDAIFVLGKLYLGATVASGSRTAVATGFADTGVAVTWPDNRAAAGFSGLTVDLGNASTDISLSRCVLASKGTLAGEDTRARFEVFGVNGAFEMIGGSIDAFASILLTNSSTLDGVVITTSGQIDANGANLSASSISNSTALSALLWNVATDPNGLLDGMSFSSSGAGHAIELGPNCPSTISLVDQSYGGYATIDGSSGDEVIYNNSGKAITINVNGGDTPTVRNGTGASTTVNNTVSFTLTNVVADSQLWVVAEPGGTLAAGTVMIGPVVVVSDPYIGPSVEANQPFKCHLAKATTSPRFKRITFLDNTGSGYARRIEQVSDE